MHQKRVVEFGEWLCLHVLKEVPHRHFVFSIPKILRRYFLYDRDLLSDLSRCAWESIKLFLQETVTEKNPIPDAAIAIQTFGDSPNVSNEICLLEEVMKRRFQKVPIRWLQEDFYMPVGLFFISFNPGF